MRKIVGTRSVLSNIIKDTSTIMSNPLSEKIVGTRSVVSNIIKDTSTIIQMNDYTDVRIQYAKNHENKKFP